MKWRDKRKIKREIKWAIDRIQREDPEMLGGHWRIPSANTAASLLEDYATDSGRPLWGREEG